MPYSKDICDRCNTDNSSVVSLSRDLDYCICLDCIEMARQAIKTLKHFKRDELGYNPEYVDVKLMYGLDMLRDSVDAPFITGDLYATRGHIATGYHPRGMAADGFFKSKLTLEEQYNLVNWWPGGVIVYPFWRRPGFHFDTGPKRRLWRAANGSYHNIVGSERPWTR